MNNKEMPLLPIALMEQLQIMFNLILIPVPRPYNYSNTFKIVQ